MNFYGAVATETGGEKMINRDSACLKIADAGERGRIAMAMVFG